MKKIFIPLVAIVLVSILIFGGCAAPAPAPTPAPTPAPAPTPTPAPAPVKPITLSFTTFDPAVSAFEPILTDWAKQLEERTGGRYTVEFSWGGAMGPMDQQYELVRDGVADLGFTLSLVEPDTFPRSSVMELPFVIVDKVEGAKVYWELYKSGLLDEDYKDVKMLYAWGALGERVFLAKGPLRGLSDLKGKKVAAMSPAAVDELEKLGCVPVFTPPPDVKMSLSKGMTEGLLGVWTAFPQYQYWEDLRYSLDPGWKSIGLMSIMNKNTWNELPKDVQAIIDDMTASEKHVNWAGELMVSQAEQGRKEVLARGGEINTWSAEDLAEIGKRFAPIWTDWISDKEAKGIPAKEIISKVASIIKSLQVEKPCVGYEP